MDAVVYVDVVVIVDEVDVFGDFADDYCVYSSKLHIIS